MKRKTNVFLRSFYLNSVIIFCVFLAVAGISKSYEGIRQVGFGEYKKAIEITENEIRILDFNINFKAP